MTDRSTLSFGSLYKLARWVEGNRQKLNGKPKAEIAHLATTELGFTVSPSNLESALKAAGIELASARRVGDGSNLDRSVMLATAITDLHKALGVKVPDYVRCITSKSSREELVEAFAKRDGNLA